VQAIHAFSNQCRTSSGYTQATPGCIILSEGDIPRLVAIVPDGTPVTVRWQSAPLHPAPGSVVRVSFWCYWGGYEHLNNDNCRAQRDRAP
jgi:hypothetical protein